MRDPESPEQPEPRRAQIEGRESRAPFDSSALNNIPRTSADDPPYRSWWVVSGSEER
jgi:hypothetical protein